MAKAPKKFSAGMSMALSLVRPRRSALRKFGIKRGEGLDVTKFVAMIAYDTPPP